MLINSYWIISIVFLFFISKFNKFNGKSRNKGKVRKVRKREERQGISNMSNLNVKMDMENTPVLVDLDEFINTMNEVTEAKNSKKRYSRKGFLSILTRHKIDTVDKKNKKKSTKSKTKKKTTSKKKKGG